MRRCGLVGAFFNLTNRRLTLLRMRYLPTPRHRLAEAVLVMMLTAVATFCLPFLLPCVDPPSFDDAVGGCSAENATFVASVCRPAAPNALQHVAHGAVCGSDTGLESPLVALLLSDNNAGIKAFFHEDLGRFTPSVCFAFFCYSLLLALLTYGLALPSGLFVPCIMMGAALGRLVNEIMPYGNLSPGQYALIGAAGMLGGVCRMTISITVIVVESTGNVTSMLPIAITIMLAKVTGDFFNEGIYDLHIAIKGYPMIEDEPPPERSSLQASDVMAPAVRTVSEVEQVGTLLKLLRKTSHHGYPVTRVGGGGGVLGVIVRDQLMTILAKRRFEPRRAASPVASPHLGTIGSHAGPAMQVPPLSADDFLRPWIQTSLDEIAASLTADDLAKVVNLRPYLNEAALVTLRTTSLRRVTKLFLDMGLRHLLVVESCPRVVGIITRKDLLHGGAAAGGHGAGDATTAAARSANAAQSFGGFGGPPSINSQSIFPHSPTRCTPAEPSFISRLRSRTRSMLRRSALPAAVCHPSATRVRPPHVERGRTLTEPMLQEPLGAASVAFEAPSAALEHGAERSTTLTTTLTHIESPEHACARGTGSSVTSSVGSASSFCG